MEWHVYYVHKSRVYYTNNTGSRKYLPTRTIIRVEQRYENPEYYTNTSIAFSVEYIWRMHESSSKFGTSNNDRKIRQNVGEYSDLQITDLSS